MSSLKKHSPPSRSRKCVLDKPVLPNASDTNSFLCSLALRPGNCLETSAHRPPKRHGGDERQSPTRNAMTRLEVLNAKSQAPRFVITKCFFFVFGVEAPATNILYEQPLTYPPRALNNATRSYLGWFLGFLALTLPEAANQTRDRIFGAPSTVASSIKIQ